MNSSQQTPLLKTDNAYIKSRVIHIKTKHILDIMQDEFNEYISIFNISDKNTRAIEHTLFGHTLLQTVGITNSGICNFTPKPNSRFTLIIRLLNYEDANNLLLFLHALGDKNAKITRAYYKKDDLNNFNHRERSDDNIMPQVSFSIDGNIFYKKIFPKLKDEFLTVFINNGDLFSIVKNTTQILKTLYNSQPTSPTPLVEVQLKTSLEQPAKQIKADDINKNNCNASCKKPSEENQVATYTMRK